MLRNKSRFAKRPEEMKVCSKGSVPLAKSIPVGKAALKTQLRTGWAGLGLLQGARRAVPVRWGRGRR